jgi:hypothetical protein
LTFTGTKKLLREQKIDLITSARKLSVSVSVSTEILVSVSADILESAIFKAFGIGRLFAVHLCKIWLLKLLKAFLGVEPWSSAVVLKPGVATHLCVAHILQGVAKKY